MSFSSFSHLGGFLAVGLLSLLIGGVRPIGAVSPAPPYRYVQCHMGTRVEFVLYAPSQSIADTAAEAAYQQIVELEQVMSDYRADSEIRLLAHRAAPGQPQAVSLHLGRVLSLAQTVSERTDGAFDVTVGPLVRLWRRAARTRRVPESSRIDAARNSVGYRLVTIDSSLRQVVLTRPGMRIDLGGIAKGYIADRALEQLQLHGVSAALVDAGGDLAIGAAPPGKSGWRIAAAPFDKAAKYWTLSQCGVATSGDNARGFEAGGQRWSHIIDPRTGWALQNAWSATVVANTCAEADALASAACVAGPQAARGWLQNNAAFFAARRARREGN